jgi:tripartite-type tricarboxylate transporter receptor subunit TctC
VKFLETFPRRAFLAGAMACASSMVFGQSSGYPVRPIKLVVVFPPGGGTDVAARIVAPKLSEKLGQPVIVENRPGAGGAVGIDYVAKSQPDGYTLVLASSGGLTALPHLIRNLGYNPQKDLQPISAFCISPLVLIAGPSFKGKNVRDLIALAKSRPGQIAYSSGGSGTATHLAGELFKAVSKTDLMHIPYKGSAPASVAVMSGEVAVSFSDLGTVRGLISSGKLRALGVLDKKRSYVAPEIPTVAESGLPGYDVEGWFAVLAPAGTPHDVVTKLNTALASILSSTEVKARLSTASLETAYSTPEELRTKIDRDSAKWGALIKQFNITVD